MEGPPVTSPPVDLDRLESLFEPGWLYRCDYCGWPLAAGIREGCVDGNCSMRPMPSNADTPRKQTVRYLVSRARRAQEAENHVAALLDGLDENEGDACGLSQDEWNKRTKAARAFMESP